MLHKANSISCSFPFINHKSWEARSPWGILFPLGSQSWKDFHTRVWGRPLCVNWIAVLFINLSGASDEKKRDFTRDSAEKGNASCVWRVAALGRIKDKERDEWRGVKASMRAAALCISGSSGWDWVLTSLAPLWLTHGISALLLGNSSFVSGLSPLEKLLFTYFHLSVSQ